MRRMTKKEEKKRKNITKVKSIKQGAERKWNKGKGNERR